jgi:hypothetical protein
MSRCIDASVKHAAAAIDHMTVSQLNPIASGLYVNKEMQGRGNTSARFNLIFPLTPRPAVRYSNASVVSSPAVSLPIRQA